MPDYFVRFLLLIFILSGCNSEKKQDLNSVAPGITDLDKYIPVNLIRVIDSLKIKSGKLTILIDKSDRELHVLAGNRILKKYRIVLGKDGQDDKFCQGDRCTPEGEFFIINKYPHPKWKYFLWLNYPNKESRKKFESAIKMGLIPANSKIGGEVGIHGVPDGKDWYIDSGIDWTLGCISLKNQDISELYKIITKKTRIKIQK